MRQLITRIDDDLHAQLKCRAKAEGRSINALVTELLADRVMAAQTRVGIRHRARTAGSLVVPPMPRWIPPRDEVHLATRGSGRSVSEALEAERSAR